MSRARNRNNEAIKRTGIPTPFLSGFLGFFTLAPPNEVGFFDFLLLNGPALLAFPPLNELVLLDFPPFDGLEAAMRYYTPNKPIKIAILQKLS